MGFELDGKIQKKQHGRAMVRLCCLYWKTYCVFALQIDILSVYARVFFHGLEGFIA